MNFVQSITVCPLDSDKLMKSARLCEKKPSFELGFSRGSERRVYKPTQPAKPVLNFFFSSELQYLSKQWYFSIAGWFLLFKVLLMAFLLVCCLFVFFFLIYKIGNYLLTKNQFFKTDAQVWWTSETPTGKNRLNLYRNNGRYVYKRNTLFPKHSHYHI